jgi:hypothetical protein
MSSSIGNGRGARSESSPQKVAVVIVLVAMCFQSKAGIARMMDSGTEAALIAKERSNTEKRWWIDGYRMQPRM